MANEKSRNAKRVVSVIMALSIVASQVVLPANVDWGGLVGSTITASANYDENTKTETISLTADTNEGDKATISGSHGEYGMKMENDYGIEEK